MDSLDLLLSDLIIDENRKQDNIELKRPVVNIFYGDFGQGELETFENTIKNRVGHSSRVQHCHIMKTDSEKKEVFYNIKIDALQNMDSLAMTKWDSLKNDKKSKEELKSELEKYGSYVFNEVSMVNYELSGMIRINMIMKAAFVGNALLPEVITWIKESMQVFFTSGVTVDVYCVLEQRAYTEEQAYNNRKALNYCSCKLLEEMTNEKRINMVYMLSDFLSEGRLLDETEFLEIYKTMALKIIMDNGKSVGNDPRTYNEDSVKRNIKSSENRSFCTLGKLNLQVDKAARTKIIVKFLVDDLYDVNKENSNSEYLLKSMNLEQNEIKNRIDSVCAPQESIKAATLYPMIVAEAYEDADLVSPMKTRADNVREIYGKNLDYFCEANFQRDRAVKQQFLDEVKREILHVLNSAYYNGQYNLADIYDVTIQVENTMQSMQEQFEDEEKSACVEFEHWKDECCDQTVTSLCAEKVKETNKSKAIYELGKQYIEQSLKCYQSKERLGLVSECNELIKVTLKYYKDMALKLKDLSSKMEEQIIYYAESDKLLKHGNICTYYEKITKEIIQQNGEYKKFKNELGNRICRRDISEKDLIQSIAHCCKEIVLKDGRFTDDVEAEMLGRLKDYKEYTSDRSIYELIIQTIFDNQTLYMNHSASNNDIRSYVCFMVNTNNQLINNINEVSRTKNTVQTFVEKEHDGMDIVFVEGCFISDDIYQFGEYRNVYQNLSEKRREVL